MGFGEVAQAKLLPWQAEADNRSSIIRFLEQHFEHLESKYITMMTMMTTMMKMTITMIIESKIPCKKNILYNLTRAHSYTHNAQSHQVNVCICYAVNTRSVNRNDKFFSRIVCYNANCKHG